MGMTNNREDYLTAIFKIIEREGSASNHRISEYLGIARASVSEMLKKLAEDGILKIRGRFISLSAEGEELARLILSKHRLWETFLQDCLKYNWKDVHRQADLLEHITDGEMMKRLNAFLNYPTHCPHGAPIYINLRGEEREEEEELRLGSLKIGERARIVKVDDEPGLLSYLDRLGLKLDLVLSAESYEEYDGTMRLFVGEEGRRVSVSEKAQKHIYVKTLGEQADSPEKAEEAKRIGRKEKRARGGEGAS